MHKLPFLLIFLTVIVSYGPINLYIGKRSWQILFRHVQRLNKQAYWLIFFVFSFAYIAARLGEQILPVVLTRILSILGAFWLGVLFYLLPIIVIFDTIGLLGAVFRIWPRRNTSRPWPGLIIFLSVLGIVIYGVWNAQHPQVTHYDLEVEKQAGAISSLHVVMVSDIHLGTINHDGYLRKLVELINQQKPDVVLFTGDIIDEEINSFVEKEISSEFPDLKAEYGVYAVLGNHEYIGGNADLTTETLEAAGVIVLNDCWICIEDSFYLIGREDISGTNIGNQRRKDLNSLMNGINKNRPLIVLDHQPSQLDESQAEGIDIQLSGHTHQGQLFPVQFVTRKIFKNDYGFKRTGNLQVIVSSGYGTWGPPMRVGNKPEIVDITITFDKGSEF
ncbi:MAG: metallophosphoesterase [Desulfitobacteriaceae bacterium]|nr:metallophosphoesterase [Desulfitobacteriaceae bacterium]